MTFSNLLIHFMKFLGPSNLRKKGFYSLLKQVVPTKKEIARLENVTEKNDNANGKMLFRTKKYYIIGVYNLYKLWFILQKV